MQLPPVVLGVLACAGLFIVGVIAFPFVKKRAKRRYAERERKLEGGVPAPWTSEAALTPGTIHLREWMKSLSEPTYLLAGSETPGFTKLGGVPDLPAGMAWPRTETGPRQFLLQVDLAEFPREGAEDWLPREGKLFAFLDPVGRHAVDLVTVIHTFEAPSNGNETPAGVIESPEKRANPMRFRSAPSLDWLDEGALKLYQDETIDPREEAAGVTSMSFAGMTHRVGGFPDEIQSQCLRLTCEQRLRRPDIECGDWGLGEPYPDEANEASKDWRLLFQIDSDGDLDWNWGDGGMIYVLIRREDAKRGDFSKTVTEYQFY
jgi:hypothetical protein